MPRPLLGTEVEGRITALSEQGQSSRSIGKILKNQNLTVSQSTISRVIRNDGKMRQAIANGTTVSIKRHRPVRSKDTITKVKALVTRRNPMTQRNIANRCGISQKSVHNIIHDDLKLKTRRKRRVHKLTPKHKQNRKVNSRKLYERHLAGPKSEFAVTLDEAWIYPSYTNGERKICYRKPGENVPDDWVKENSESFEKGIMVIGGLSGRGPLPLLRVAPNAKINATVYVEEVMKPILETYIPALYPGEVNKVFVHHDKASSHTAAITQAYFKKAHAKFGITFITNEEILVKSPDTSPMDFFGFGYLKQMLFKSRAKTIAGVWKAARNIWAGVSNEMCKKVYQSWKIRLRAVAERQGEHIEQVKAIHSKKLRL